MYVYIVYNTVSGVDAVYFRKMGKSLIHLFTNSYLNSDINFWSKYTPTCKGTFNDYVDKKRW